MLMVTFPPSSPLSWSLCNDTILLVSSPSVISILLVSPPSFSTLTSVSSHSLLNTPSAGLYQAFLPEVSPMMNAEHPEDPPSYNAISTPVVSPVTYSPPYSSRREVVKGVPPGLQDLLQINQLSIHERFSVSQRWARSFDVLDHRGQRVYQAIQYVECCGPNFDLRVRDRRGDEIMGVIESNSCGCSREAALTLKGDKCIGFVSFPSNNFITHLSIMDSSREVLLLILGPSLKISIFGNISFEVKSRDEQHVVGMIRSEGNQYTVIFPMDLEVTMKAMIMASCFYLDSIIYDQRRSVTDRPSSS